MRSCKVIHTIETSEPGGAEKILVQIADGLRGEYEPYGLMLAEGWTSAELIARGIPVYCNQLSHSFDLGWVRRTIRYIREHDIRLIHSHEFTTNAYSLLVARIAGIPVICTAHGKNYYPEKFYRRQAYRWVARYADKFVAVSNDLKLFLVDRIGISEDNIIVVHNGIDTSSYDVTKYNRDEIRKGIGLTRNDYVIVVVAALFEMKGHKDLIISLTDLNCLQSNIKVLFIGDGPYRERLKHLTVELGLENVIRFTGFRNDVAQLLSASDLFILPSYSEGLPISVLEAMSAGLPVIATDVGGLSEIITEGNNGYLVPPKEPEALTLAIERCMQNKNITNTVRKAGKSYVNAEFSMDSMLENYRTIYRDLLSE